MSVHHCDSCYLVAFCKPPSFQFPVSRGGARGGHRRLKPPVGEKLTIRREIFTDDNTYIVQTMSTCY